MAGKETGESDFDIVPSYMMVGPLRESAQRIIEDRKKMEKGIIPEEYNGPEDIERMTSLINRLETKLGVCAPLNVCEESVLRYEWMIYQSKEILGHMNLQNNSTH